MTEQQTCKDCKCIYAVDVSTLNDLESDGHVVLCSKHAQVETLTRQLETAMKALEEIRQRAEHAHHTMDGSPLHLFSATIHYAADQALDGIRKEQG